MVIVRVIALAASLVFASIPLVSIAKVNPSLSEAERGIHRDDNEDVARHLRIDALKVDVAVAGRSAEVTMTMTITADGDDALEADLALALPADAVVTGYALDVDGWLIPGQLLERPKARNVYEDEVRAGIDPGLAEVASENCFKTRIYPIDAKHPRQFRLSFVAPFDPDRGLLLPLMRDAPIGKLMASVRIEGFATAPTVRFAGADLALVRSVTGWTGTMNAADARLGEGLAVDGGALAAPMIVTRHPNGQRFFVIEDRAGAASRTERTGGRVRIYWDRSVSHGNDRIESETDALLAYLARRKPGQIELVTFASDAPTKVTVGNTTELRRLLGAVVYRGATSFSGLEAAAPERADDCILVSDGDVTIDHAVEFVPDCRLSALTSSPGADGARLSRLVAPSGGVVVRLGDAITSEAAATRLASNNAGVVAVRDRQGNKIVVRALPAPRGNWAVAGPMPVDGPVTVRLSDGSIRTYRADGAVLPATAPGALWAAQEVASLADDPARHGEMVNLAKRFQVAGADMAFLVMERPDQYLRAGIAPTEGFSKEWMEEYREAKQSQEADKAGAVKERFAFVLEQWQQRKAWWNKRFVPGVHRKQDGRAPSRNAVAMAPPPPMVVPPSPVSAPQAMAVAPATVGADADLIVTGARRSEPAASPAQERERTDIKLDLADLGAKRPYIAALAGAAPADRNSVLEEQARAYGTVPGFYLDVAEWFRAKGDTATAMQLMLSALDLPTTDDETRQIVAFRLEREGAYDRAVELAERLAAVNAEFRPQPGRDLALALAARGRAHGKAGRADLERAFKLLTETALNPASSDFDGIEVISLMEANALIPEIKAVGGHWSLDPRLVAHLDTDVRIVIEWTADDADIDLWVDEPDRERVMYSNKLSSAGGQISNDMTDGFGPEEYTIHRATNGRYEVRINGYDADRLNPNGPGHVLIRLIRNFARATQRETMVDADLTFQHGGNRNDEHNVKPVATLRVDGTK